MKVVVLYRPNSEYSGDVERYFAEFKTQHRDIEVEMIDRDSAEGVSRATTYDIWQFPAVLVVRNDGSLINSWVGETLPSQNELLGYAMS